MVSEYANGRYGWMLALMFVSWAISTWALAFALSPLATTWPARLGIGPQCGFASTAAGNPLTEADQRAKLRLVADAARAIWG